MTYPAFLSLITDDLGIDTNPWFPFSIDRLFRYRTDYDEPKRRAKKLDPIIIQHWTTGGASGGNCHNSDSPESSRVSADPAPMTFADLDRVLEYICPSIGFLAYRRLCAQVVETGEETYYEYYGNYTTYAYQLVKVRALYDKLVEMELIKP